jgi:hypothetical protein
MPDHTRHRTRAHRTLIASGALACAAITLFGAHLVVTFDGRDPAAGAPPAASGPAPTATSAPVAPSPDATTGDSLIVAARPAAKDPSRDRAARDRAARDRAARDRARDVASPAVPGPAPAASASMVPATGEQAAAATTFLDEFVVHHVALDSEQLFTRLHPAIAVAFGEEACRGYIELTVGSVDAVRVSDVVGVTTFRLDTPAGPVEFPGAIAVDVELTYFDGEVASTRVHLPYHDGVVFWLTTCGN